MGILGSLIGTGVGAIGTALGQWQASKAAKRAKANIESAKQQNQAWYERRYNEDATQRADAQRVLTMTADNIRKRNKQAAAAQAVTGGTDESVAATREANNQALASAASGIAANAQASKDNVEQRYQATNSDLNNQLTNIEMNRANQITTATSNFGQAAMNTGIAIDEYNTLKKQES
jgi:hypothetical protein